MTPTLGIKISKCRDCTPAKWEVTRIHVAKADGGRAKIEGAASKDAVVEVLLDVGVM